MRYLSILTFLFSIAVINPAHAGIVVDSNGIVQSFTPDSDPDSLGTLYFYAGSYDSVLADGTPAYLFTEASSSSYGAEFLQALQDRPDGSLDKDIRYLFDRGDRDQGDGVLRRNTKDFYFVSLSFVDDWGTVNGIWSNDSSGYALVDITLYWASTTAPSTSPTVPEPSTAIAMGLLGLAGLAGNRRRRRQS